MWNDKMFHYILLKIHTTLQLLINNVWCYLYRENAYLHPQKNTFFQLAKHAILTTNLTSVTLGLIITSTLITANYLVIVGHVVMCLPIHMLLSSFSLLMHSILQCAISRHACLNMQTRAAQFTEAML